MIAPLQIIQIRLGRAYGIPVEEAQKFPIHSYTELSGTEEAWWVDNVSQGEDGVMYGMWSATPILSVRIPEEEAFTDSYIITKVELDLPSNHLFDMCTIYWTGDKTPEFSENCVYKFPRNIFSGKQVVYIDENVTGLMIVPAVTRGANFSVNGISLTKYEVPIDFANKS